MIEMVNKYNNFKQDIIIYIYQEISEHVSKVQISM